MLSKFKLSIVLPCAGEGTRLGLPYPKELHRIEPGMSLIDYSLRHIQSDPSLISRVILTITPKKMAVYDYVKEALPNTDVRYVLFNNNYSEWPGSILSAQEHFDDYNVVLLPDSVIKLHNEEKLISRYLEHFSEGSDVVFSYKRELRSEIMKNLGALKIEENKVIDFCDKPDEKLTDNYNGFWTSFGFKKGVSTNLLNLMMESVSRKTVDIGEMNTTISAFAVENYTDLGTWASIKKYISENQR